MKTATFLAAALLSLASPASAGQPVHFEADHHGYGRFLLERTHKAVLSLDEARGVRVRIGVAQVDLNSDNQPEFVVRPDGPSMCDRSGCATYAYMLIGREWKIVFHAHTRELEVRPSGAGMAALSSAGETWEWDGEWYSPAETSQSK